VTKAITTRSRMSNNSSRSGPTKVAI
jgi:hypothetical protein